MQCTSFCKAYANSTLVRHFNSRKRRLLLLQILYQHLTTPSPKLKRDKGCQQRPSNRSIRFRRPNVFVNDHNQVYSSPNAAHLPTIPLVDCDIDNPQDTFVPHWANVVRPELPFTPIEFDMSNYIISQLSVPPSLPLPVQQTPDGSWELDREHQDRRRTLDNLLL